MRRSGAPLTEGVPGFYTVDGFYKVLLPTLPSATIRIASSWVLGRDAQIDPVSPQVISLQRDVIALYTADYAKQWDAMDDIDVEPMRNLQQAVQELYSGIATIADARSAGRHHPPAHPDRSATTTRGVAERHKLRRRPPARGHTAGHRRCHAFAGSARTDRRSSAGTAGQGDRNPIRRADRFRRQGPGHQSTTLKLLNDLKCNSRSSEHRPRGAPLPLAAAMTGPVAAGRGQSRSTAGGPLAAGDGITGSQLRGGGAGSGEEAFGAPAGLRRCATRRSPAAIRSHLDRATTFRWMTSRDCSRRAGCWTSSSATACNRSSTRRAPPGRRSRSPA